MSKRCYASFLVVFNRPINMFCFFFQAEDGIRYGTVTGVQTCALPIFVATFCDQLQREVGAEAVDRGDVLSEQPEQRRADVESQGVRLIGSVPTPRDWRR